ncbi:MAG: type II toxin-antitoxin system RelE/ParE family toxin, partial [Spirochaetota bacterium]|nr:type II toxin-antitoxin system RelE/ParE family toxin [Spirochaetota bacterium]
PEYHDEFTREVFEGNYRIIYRIVDKERIDILTVVHGAQEL